MEARKHFLKVTFAPKKILGISIPFTEKVRYYSKECTANEWMEAMAVVRAEFADYTNIKMESY